MIYLQSFTLPTDEEESGFLAFNNKARMTCYNSYYPFGIFKYRAFPELHFNDVTIFYGNNGTGKSTLINLIADKLKLKRTTPYNRTDFFEDYLEMCDYTAARAIPHNSEIITSDGVFERVLEIRRLNDGIDDRRERLVEEYISERSNEEPNLLRGIDDYERWKRVSDMRNRNTTTSRFLRKSLVRNLTERSNGESALAYFVDSIKENTLYLLDEPENSLSAENQLNLKYFIEDCIKEHGCQFVISTHSPFLLSIRHATVYDIDATPPAERRWSELSSVRIYYDFFKEYGGEFE